MLKIIQRYLAFNFIAPFLISTIFFVTFLLTFQLFRLTRIIFNKSVEISFVLELVGHIALSFVPMALPLSAFLATTFVLNRLSEDSEIISMRSFGMTKFQLLLPFIIIGALLSSVIFSLGQVVIPFSKRKFRNNVIQLTSRGLLADIRPGRFYTDIPDVTIFSERVKNSGDSLEDVFIYFKKNGKPYKKNNIDKDKSGVEQVIFAKKGNLIKKKRGEMEIESIRMQLFDGSITKIYPNGTELEKIFFEEYDFPIIDISSGPNFVTKDDMRTSKELWALIQKNEKEGLRTKSAMKSKLEFFSRIGTSLQCLLFIFLGFVLGIKRGRESTQNSGLFGLTLLIMYYVIFFTGVSLSKKAIIPVEITVFFPLLITFAISLGLYKKLDWIG